ncbi:hypothetical protein [Pusillimonas noertemannii]|uniref:hypothetical protein n=1 Tax=Pusillimonas noertemannii TaxID=305977 RepID=UPI0033402BE9
MTAPDRIWAASVTENYGEWQTTTDGLPRPTEYTRSDLVAELEAENERLKQRLADHTRATSTVDAHETANVSDKPEGQQEPVARGVVWFGYDENTGEFTGEYCSVKPHDARGMRPYIPYTTRPADQAVTEAMVDAACEAFGLHERKHGLNHRQAGMREALKAAMEAGR